MNIGFDIDDTITRCPEFFSVISKALVGAGHHVYIITFRTNTDEVAELMHDEGIAFTEIITCGAEIPPDGFSKWKANIIHQRSIKIYFEDYCDVVNEVDESTVVFMPISRRLGMVGYFDPCEEDSA